MPPWAASAASPQLAPNLVGTPNDIREWMAYRTAKGAHAQRDPPQLARGWRAEFVGRLFEDLLDAKLSIRVGDPKSEHPLVFERLDQEPRANS